MIASADATWRTIVPGPQPLGEHYRVGAGQVDDRGYLFVWNDADAEAAPVLRKRARFVMAGREWMRKHAPRQWAAFMAAKLLGTIRVRIVGDAFATWPLILEEDEDA